MTSRIISKRVQTSHSDSRFDRALARLFPDWSRRRLKALIHARKVKINGTLAGINTVLTPGDLVQLHLDEAMPTPALERLHESDDFIYLYKPSGQHVVAQYPGEPNTLATALAMAYPACVQASDDPRDGGAIHRLDKLTSGVVAVAKHRAAYRAGRSAMGDGTPRKEYLALVDARPQVQAADYRWTLLDARPQPSVWADLHTDFLDWTPLDPGQLLVRAPLGLGTHKSRVYVSPKGRPSHSTLTWLARAPAPSRLRLAHLTLHTGMRHQLRVHLSALGHPIAHDPLYGLYPDPMHRLALHAWRLDLGDLDKNSGPITAPLRADFLNMAATGSRLLPKGP